jgi:CRISPR/Cas system CSM-associated protein Csm3 (group 7 of RAMP superfamily)
LADSIIKKTTTLYSSVLERKAETSTPAESFVDEDSISSVNTYVYARIYNSIELLSSVKSELEDEEISMFFDYSAKPEVEKRLHDLAALIFEQANLNDAIANKLFEEKSKAIASTEQAFHMKIKNAHEETAAAFEAHMASRKRSAKKLKA